MRLIIASDLHYAGPIEQQRNDHELGVATNRIQRLLVRMYRKYIWLDSPQAHSYLLDTFLDTAPQADTIILLGDLSCDTKFVGVSDPGAKQSAKLCLHKIKSHFKKEVYATPGDHDLGKMSLVGGVGGPRIESWRVWTEELGLPGLWSFDLGTFTFIGLASTIIALPVFEPEMLPQERPQWFRIREDYLAKVSSLLEDVRPKQNLVLCLHDPTALPYLYELDALQKRVDKLFVTFIGHLHSRAVYKLASKLVGMPRIQILGNTIRRMSSALKQGAVWKKFKLQLCPSLTGIQLFKDGGFLILNYDNQTESLTWEFKPLPWQEVVPQGLPTPER